MSYKQGFTLIELSIVLVIIGLIVGGVLVGQDLIEAAQARKVISQMESYQAAANTFRLKYNCKAGDCSKATTFGFQQNGNGDGIIGCGGGASRITDPGTTVYYCSHYGGMANGSMIRTAGENNKFFMHLSEAGLTSDTISLNPDGNVANAMDQYFPKISIGNSYLVIYTWASHTYIRTGVVATDGSGNPSGQQTGALKGSQLHFITKKMGQDPQNMMNGTCVNAGMCTTPPPSLFNDRVVAIHHYNSGYLHTSPNEIVATGRCMNANAGIYTYDLSGKCNMLWEIDF